MEILNLDHALTCPSCARQGRLRGTLTVSKNSGAWLSFVPHQVPAGFVLISNSRTRLNCACGTTVWPDAGSAMAGCAPDCAPV